MADKFLNNPKFDSFEVLLASLAPDGTNIDRDRLMYEAGRQSVLQTVPKKRNSLAVWRTASILSTCAAVVLALLLANRPVDRTERIVTDVAIPEKSPIDAAVEKQKSFPQEVVHSDFPQPENRFSTWVLAFFDILPTDDEFPIRRLDKLLEESSYVYRRTDEDSVSSLPPQPPKTYRELMREFRLKTGDDRSSFFRSDNPLDLFGEGR